MFRGERQVMLRRDRPRKAAEVRQSLARATALPPQEASLFEALRAERTRLAKQQGVPPYVIFHDATLMQMTLARPRTLADLLDLPGVGKAKLDRYGAVFLQVLAEHKG